MQQNILPGSTGWSCNLDLFSGEIKKMLLKIIKMSEISYNMEQNSDK